MKMCLFSPDFLFFLLSVSASGSPLTILLSLSEMAISDLFRKSNVLNDSSNPKCGIKVEVH